MKTIKVNDRSEIPNYFTGIVDYLNEDKEWFKNGKQHREDGPALELISGQKHWYKEGLWHREDGPAVEYADGSEDWYYLDGIYFYKINLNDFVVLDHNKGKYGIMWYKLLDKDRIFEYPDIPGLITK